MSPSTRAAWASPHLVPLARMLSAQSGTSTGSVEATQTVTCIYSPSGAGWASLHAVPRTLARWRSRSSFSKPLEWVIMSTQSRTPWVAPELTRLAQVRSSFSGIQKTYNEKSAAPSKSNCYAPSGPVWSIEVLSRGRWPP